MSRVAFLRAVNVGGRTVKMERLRTVFESLKFREVSTVIASGNVRFAARGEDAALERRIERALAEAFGFEVDTFVRSDDEVVRLAAADPFGADASDTLMVGFLKVAPDRAATERVEALRTPDDDLRVVGRELWWRRRGRLSDTKLAGGGLEKALGAPMTVRNLTTVRRLAALATQGPHDA
jgi:uncharacterized protein (DUF1697 family)